MQASALAAIAAVAVQIDRFLRLQVIVDLLMRSAPPLLMIVASPVLVAVLIGTPRGCFGIPGQASAVCIFGMAVAILAQYCHIV